MRRIGLLGGTFDPVHCGHLRLAIEVRERLELDEVRLIPAARPPLRNYPSATEEQRLAMLNITTRLFPSLVIDDRELHRAGPSYTIDTLESVRREAPDDALWLIVGMDAFLRLERWHRWEELPTQANLAVATRPGYDPPTDGKLRQWLDTHATMALDTLGSRHHGVVRAIEIPLLDISATYLRHQIAHGKDVRLLSPPAVINFIEEHRLYAYRQ